MLPSHRSARSCPPSGLTLIEVVAGLALLGTLVASSLIASSSHLSQMKAAERKLLAAKVMDEFLAQWSRTDFQITSAEAAAQSAGASLVGERSSELPFNSPQLISSPVIRLGKRFRDAPEGMLIAEFDVYLDTLARRSAWGEVLAVSDE